MQRAKRIALLWLVGAACIFLLTTVAELRHWLMPWPIWAGLIKMASEAALVGGLADWFAVTALFRPIPSRYAIPHTNIIAQNKVSVASNLSLFLKEKFFNAQTVSQLIEKSQPAQGFARWLKQADNAQRLSQFMATTVAEVVRVLDDKPIQQMLLSGVKRALRKMDMSPLATGILKVLTRDGRHQDVLDQLLLKIAAVAKQPESQAFIAQKLHLYLKEEYHRLEKILPTSWLSEQGAEIASKAIASILNDIADDPVHPVREHFDLYLDDFIQKMDADPAMANKLNSLRDQLVENDKLHLYLAQIWQDTKTWLIEDVGAQGGQFSSKLGEAFQKLGQAIENDEALATAINGHAAEVGRKVAPEVADFLTGHIRDTIIAWDDKQMAEQIELNIGKDLQKVRINGTLVGGLIGAILFMLENLIRLI
ncbi:DUF445 domain-containing protein [Alteromonas sp. 14N.309.X.WAT.G.H12]|uniref:DUF445 domain-containing protein n=1 Tax=Alteromonas sp. 14N.309.X.WAT.G.H12 TaxID=3120824 RepID=UPI002FCE84D8